MSALANLAGMYPPEGMEIWNRNLTWQPIPVHSQPRETDPVINIERKLVYLSCVHTSLLLSQC